MPFDLGRAVSWALDAVSFVEDRLGFCPDPWQARVLRSRAPPGDNPQTIRGFSAPALVLMDEAAFIHDETFGATIPMLAAAPEGRIILMSTPYISAGFFYQIWHGTGDWERYELKTSECPRVAREWLEARKREEPLRFGREYECEFGSPEDSLFTAAMLDRMAARDFEPLHL